MDLLLKSDRDLIEPRSAPAVAQQVRKLNRLARSLEARTPGSAGHARRVAFYSAATAQQLGLSAEQVERVRRAAALHDIGKVRTPVAIVNKPGPLNSAEFAVVQRHAAVGAWMVSGLGDQELAAIVRGHHERFDGRGYPDGLAGEAIPFGARIVAVADTYDALASTRPYRVAKGQAETLALLDAEAGTQFDPDVVSAFREFRSQQRRRRRVVFRG